MKDNTLSNLYEIKDYTTKRESSYDRTGGNQDWFTIKANSELEIANLSGPSIIRHIWCTIGGDELNYLRKIVLEIYWDDEPHPSVCVPIGDFFGIGFGIRKNFTSAAFAMSPQDGRSMNCYFPMPFKKSAKVKIINECESNINFYFYIDYETNIDLEENVGYFHAQWNRENSTDGWYKDGENIANDTVGEGEFPWMPTVWNTKNTDGNDNYTILDAEGEGHYVGCNLNIDNYKEQPNHWYGEGDDMIFIDGEVWPPTLHGTGTEDYFNTAFCPEDEFATPYYGITVYSGKNSSRKWSGKNSMYRLHVLDPIRFKKSIKVTIEHGHANKLDNDYSSTAYWYQKEPHKTFSPLLKVKDRLPRS